MSEITEFIQHLKCKFAGERRMFTRSVYCNRLDQWVSVNYCRLCTHKDKVSRSWKETTRSMNDINTEKES